MLCSGSDRTSSRPLEDPIRPLTFGLIGALALAAGLVLVRKTRQEEIERPNVVPPGETQPVQISPERIRALGY